jgi:hypothetical protein
MNFELIEGAFYAVIEEACQYAVESSHDAATNEHLLVKLLEAPGSVLSERLGSARGSVHDYLVKLLAAREKETAEVEPGIDGALAETIEAAEEKYSGRKIGEPDYLLALLGGSSEGAACLLAAGLSREQVATRRAPASVAAPVERRKNILAGDRIWELTARMRTLARSVQGEMIEPTRKTLQAAEQRVAQARSEMEEAVHAADAGIQKPRAEVEELLNRARAHLATQRISVSDGPPQLPETSSSGVPPQERVRQSPATGSMAEAYTLIAKVKQTVEEGIIKVTKPKNPLWLDEGSGCGLIIVAVIIGSACAAMLHNGNGFFLGFFVFYVPVMWCLNYAPATKLEIAYRHASGNGRRAVGMLEDYRAGVETRGQAEVQAAEQQLRTEIARLERGLRPQMEKFRQSIAAFSEDTGFAGAEWNEPLWRDWAPASTPVFAARFGQLVAETADLRRHLPALDWRFSMPALVPFPEGRSFLLKAGGAEKEQAAHAVQSVLGRLLATIPPGKLRFTFIDPVALGNNVAAFMPLADHEESLITSRAWTEPQHIEQRLGDLTEHMETVIQKYLRTEFKTIHDYNEAAKEVAEPYRFLIVFDFPVNFSDTAARRLVSIARNGARCGVYAFIVCDTGKPLPYGFTIGELEQSATVISGRKRPNPGEPARVSTRLREDEDDDEYEDEDEDENEDENENESRYARPRDADGFRWADPDFFSWALQLDKPAPKEAMRVEVPYEKLLSLSELGPGTWWKATTSKSIRVPLGPTGARKLQFLTLGEGMGHHALIVGRPGSGKSNLMHVIITTLALAYSPDEMRVYLIDFKRGVEFKGYADHKLPHAEAIAVESEREFGLSVIERIDVELKKRGDLFRNAGAANITEYREKTGVQIARVLLLVDEFQEFFTQDDHVARQTTLILDRLVRQGRAFGLHIILGSQTLAGNYNLSRSTLDQMAVRIAMQCSEADSRLILSDDNPAARLLSRPGEAIYNAASGLVEGNNLFQVARFSDEDREERLKLVNQIARESGKPVPVPIVFEGNELAQVADCRKLQELLAGDDWPAKKSVELWLGDPIAIRDPIAARLRRQSGSHLLILSRDEAEGVGMCVAAILSILAQQRPDLALVYVADFTLADSEWAERAEEIEKFFPHKPKVLSRQRDVAATLKDIADEVKRRLEVPPEEASIYFVLQGLQRIKLLRTEDESFTYDDESATPSELFALILREGPEVGVHVIAWCDTYANAARVADRRTMTEFGLRAGGVMSADDSSHFFDDTAAARIDKPHRVIFFDEERPGQLDKFRPYSMPAREWVAETGRRLSERKSKA